LLKLVSASTVPIDRLAVAVAHLEAAIAHINNDTQARMPIRGNVGSADVEELRLIVCAVADIIAALQAKQAPPAQVA
jgi:hypothetical protein